MSKSDTEHDINTDLDWVQECMYVRVLPCDVCYQWAKVSALSTDFITPPDHNSISFLFDVNPVQLPVNDIGIAKTFFFTNGQLCLTSVLQIGLKRKQKPR